MGGGCFNGKGAGEAMHLLKTERGKYILGIAGLSAALVLLLLSDVVFPGDGEAAGRFLAWVCGYLLLTVSVRAITGTSRK